MDGDELRAAYRAVVVKYALQGVIMRAPQDLPLFQRIDAPPPMSSPRPTPTDLGEDDRALLERVVLAEATTLAARTLAHECLNCGRAAQGVFCRPCWWGVPREVKRALGWRAELAVKQRFN